MKKIYLTMAIAGLLGTVANAQNKVSMVRTGTATTVGIRAGVNFQNINGKNSSGTELKNDLLTGFNGGLNVEVPLSSGFYLQPGVLYSLKGAEWSDGSKVKLSYVEVPVNFIYKPLLGTGNLLLGFGPYVGFGIDGKVKNTAGAETDIEFDKDYTSANEGTQFKKIDAGANFLAGYEFNNKVSLQLNAQLGLMDIDKENPFKTNDQTRWRNTGFGLSLGYRF
jgi:opacity protein-like surface antigen